MAFIDEIEGRRHLRGRGTGALFAAVERAAEQGARRLSRASTIDPGHKVDRRRWL
jgi:hypothetical protein